MQNLFPTEIRSRWCTKCRQESDTRSAESCISIALTLNENTNLDERIASFFRTQEVQLKCPKGCGGTQFDEAVKLASASDLIIFQLKRFMMNTSEGMPAKLMYNIHRPIDRLDMSPYIEGPGPKVYELCAIVSHLGPMVIGGHYVAKVKLGMQWFVCNDAYCKELTSNFEVLAQDKNNEQAYLLFYQLKRPKVKF